MLIKVPIIRLDKPSLKDRRFKFIVFEYAIQSASNAQHKNIMVTARGKLIVIILNQLNTISSSTVKPNNAKTGLDFEGFTIKRMPPYNKNKQIIKGVTCLKYAKLK